MSAEKRNRKTKERFAVLRQHPYRQGATLLAALVVLLLVLLFSAMLARSLAVGHRQAHFEQRRQQAGWFADSALQRGIMRLRTSQQYVGETWTIPIEIDHRSQVAVAEIRILTRPESAAQRIIDVEARWPDDAEDRVLEQRQLIITLLPTGDSL